MRKAWLCLMLAIGGCVSTSPLIPSRYQLGIPSASADINPKSVVLIGSSAAEKAQEDGNAYTITWLAMTNSNSNASDSPDVIAANADLATNTWPKSRVHLEMSIDGGQTWPHRIGYGVQTPRGSLGSEFMWSPPNDYALLTTNAQLRMVDLDGNIFRGPVRGFPYDVGPGGLKSDLFAIAGATIDSPQADAILYTDTPESITWRQVGGGTEADLYWLTPDSMGADATHLVAVLSNVVDGVNVHSFQMPSNIPPGLSVRFCVRGKQYPSIIGYSATFEVSQ